MAKRIEYGSKFVTEFKRVAKHVHVIDGGHSECWGDGNRVLRLIHRSRRNKQPQAWLYEPGCTNDFNEAFNYADYFLPEDIRAGRSGVLTVGAA